MSKKILLFIKKEIVLIVALILAIVSAFFVHPGMEYFDYIDWRSLGILWSLMVVMQGLRQNGIFDKIGIGLLERTKSIRQLVLVLVSLCFFGSMLVTNDVALITFIPFTMLILKSANKEELLIPVIVLQTIAANLGSMLTPIGNPQNLYLYGISGMKISEFLLLMLPYAAVSGALLAVCICFIPHKRGSINIAKGEMAAEAKKANVIVYAVLFILSLLTVVRVLPFYILVPIVLVAVFIIERRTLLHVDYILLLTFIAFFIFTGNMSKITAVQELLQRLITGREVTVGVLASQCISNVPAALLLSGFTDNYNSLIVGVNLGGLGTLIASMASLISYKMFANSYSDKKGKYILTFTIMNVIFLAVLIGMAFLLKP